MQALCASRAAESEDSIAARAGLSIEYADTAERLPLVRLDRRGLVVYLNDDAHLPPLGLPRCARLLRGQEVLCELRLVARSIVRRDNRTIELTIAPSRADDDTVFWQALHTSHLHDRQADESARPGTEATPMPRTGSKTGLCPGSALDVGCEAVFGLPTHADARFVAEWLEYHFAEIIVRARGTRSSAELRGIEQRRSDTRVGVFFSYRWGGRTMVRCTAELCWWIASELERLFGLEARFDVVDAHEGIMIASDFRGPATLRS